MMVIFAALAGFQTESDLSVAERREAEKLVFRALDSEALYTLAGGLKPVSNGFWKGPLNGRPGDVVEHERIRPLLGVLRNEEYYADVLPFTSDFGGKRSLQAFVVHRESLAETIWTHADFFYPLGITPTSHPVQVLVTIEHLPEENLHRGYGYVFGYPDAAVDFYVHAHKHHRQTGKLLARSFRRLPTHAVRGGFVWAVPKGAEESAVELRILRRGNQLYEEYRRLRDSLAPEGGGVLAALQRWKNEDAFQRKSSATEREF